MKRFTGRKYWVSMRSGLIYAVEFRKGILTAAAKVKPQPFPNRADLASLPLDPGLAPLIASWPDMTPYDAHSRQGTQYAGPEYR